MVTMYWKPELLRRFGSNFKGAHDLASVHAVEEMAVVNKEAGADAAFCAEAHEHHVEAEDLHVLDALAA